MSDQVRHDGGTLDSRGLKERDFTHRKELALKGRLCSLDGSAGSVAGFSPQAPEEPNENDFGCTGEEIRGCVSVLLSSHDSTEPAPTSVKKYKYKVIMMSQVITAIYEQGALHPLTPLNLQERQRVNIQLVPEQTQETIEHILQWLGAIGMVTPPRQQRLVSPVSEAGRGPLSRELGKAARKPLSEVIIEERGKR